MKNYKLYYQDSGQGMPPPPPQTPTTGVDQSKASTKAILALVFGILGWILCGIIAAIPAWIIGAQEVKAIEEGRSSAAGKTMAKVGMWLGIIQVILGIIGLIIFLIVLIVGN